MKIKQHAKFLMFYLAFPFAVLQKNDWGRVKESKALT